MNGVKPQLARKAAAPYACEGCRSRWYKYGFFRPVEIVPDESPEADEDEAVVMMVDHDEPENLYPITIITPSKPEEEDPATVNDLKRAMLDFIKRPFDGNPFVDVDGFIAAYPHLYALKATSIGFKDTPLQSVLYRDRMKRKIIFEKKSHMPLFSFEISVMPLFFKKSQNALVFGVITQLAQ
ncbi:hypothetical protein DFS34DRAFT_646244 [Phlyctochytrium arcticum]|nr:hypothetical protein DFS34DRAFT_654873 [Phlyctochytrium arcticum]KAI9104040.1 hypothetical protein DFS34DRAFT_646244 [Phlyctochytrium arcticum]